MGFVQVMLDFVISIKYKSNGFHNRTKRNI